MNGNEIYEGDIVEVSPARFMMSDEEVILQVTDIREFYEIAMGKWEIGEIIGNIHENHEVLEQESPAPNGLFFARSSIPLFPRYAEIRSWRLVYELALLFGLPPL